MVSITPEVEFHIRQNFSWAKLPSSVKASLGNASGLYDKAVLDFSVKNQLRWRNNIVRFMRKDERKYYEELLQYGREHYMLYPYHLQDMLIEGLRVTPFAYYCSMITDVMQSEKSYDALPNFTAADCVRLLGIGRNQYIDLMNQYRAKKFFRRRGIKDLLPSKPVQISRVDPWWRVRVGYVTEDDIRTCNPEEHHLVDKIIDHGTQESGSFSRHAIIKLYNRGLIYFDIPIADTDVIVVPPLQGFVMNRVQGDYFETLLYKIFVSIDEHTSIAELATVLQVDLQQVKNAVAVFIRLDFAHKKANNVDHASYHSSWQDAPVTTSVHPSTLPGTSPLTLKDFPPGTVDSDSQISKSPSPEAQDLTLATSTSGTFQRRIGFLFDSTLTAFLMMGNLSPGLKSHAVTMFEVGKLTDELLDSFLTELNKVSEQAEGEARRYFEHAIALKTTVKFLRYNPRLLEGEDGRGLGMDLLRVESMASLDTATLSRVLQKNYTVLVSMAPLSQEVQSVSCCLPPHLGPPLSEMNSMWFKLWLYDKLGVGPPSLLLAKGTRLRMLPLFIKAYSRVLVTTWGHDPTSVYTSNLLLTLNDALTHSTVLMQAYGCREDGQLQHIPFPFDRDDEVPIPEDDLLNHPCLRKLETEVDLSHTCGYVTMIRTGAPTTIASSRKRGQNRPREKPCKVLTDADKAKEAEISEFLEDLKDLGIGEPGSENTGQSGGTESKPEQNGAETEKPDESSSGPPMSPAMTKLVSEWVPLELCFGIPLFDERTNKDVCERILECGLFQADSLRAQTQSNRVLALDLLTFISKHQDVPYFDASEGLSSIDSHAQTIPVPMPTRSLLFLNGTLENFNGR